jgi:hypothetical protein
MFSEHLPRLLGRRDFLLILSSISAWLVIQRNKLGVTEDGHRPANSVHGYGTGIYGRGAYPGSEIGSPFVQSRVQ